MYRIDLIETKPGGEAWLITTPTHAALYEAGYAFTAREAAGQVKTLLNGRKLDYILLTHSHYDHASGAAELKRAFPEAKTAASAYCAYVFTRPGALRTIAEMNRVGAKLFGLPFEEGVLEGLSVDIILKDGDLIDLGDLKLTVWETPGHTKCALSFYEPTEKLLFCCETLGAPGKLPQPTADFVVAPECMTGVEQSLRAIERALAAAPEKILLPHYQVVEGDTAMNYLRRAHSWTLKGRDLVLSGAKAGRTVEQLVQDWREMFYTPEIAGKQPEEAFLLNTVNLIPAMLKEYADQLK